MVRRAPLDGKEPVRVEDMMKNAGRAVLKGTLSLILTASLVPSQAMVAMAEELNELAAQEQQVDEAETEEAAAEAVEAAESTEEPVAEGEAVVEEIPAAEEEATATEKSAETPEVESETPALTAQADEDPTEGEPTGEEPVIEAQASANITGITFDERNLVDGTTDLYENDVELTIEATLEEVEIQDLKLSAVYTDINGEVHDGDEEQDNPKPLEVRIDRQGKAKLEVEGVYTRLALIDAEGNELDSIDLTADDAIVKKFTIDGGAVQVTGIDTLESYANNGYVNPSDKSVAIVATDIDFDMTNSSVTVNGETVDPTTSGSTHTYTIDTSADGRYTVAVNLVDRAHDDDAVTETYEFTIDRVAPVVAYTKTNEKKGIYSVTIKDEHLDPDNTYVFGSKLSTIQSNLNRYNYFHFSGHYFAGYFSSLSYDESSNTYELIAIVYYSYPADDSDPVVVAKDTAGNESRIDTIGSTDIQAPTIEGVYISAMDMTNSELAKDSGWHFFSSDDASITLRIRDNGSGISSVNIVDPSGGYTFTSDSKTTAERGELLEVTIVPLEQENPLEAYAYEDKEVTTGEGDSQTTETVREHTRGILVTITDKKGNVRVWSLAQDGSITEGDQTSTQENAVLQVLKGGNQFEEISSKHPSGLLADWTAPVLTLEGPDGGDYFNDGQEVSLTVEEANLSYLRKFEDTSSRPVLTITRKDNLTDERGTSTTYTVKDISSDNKIVVPLDADGHYTVSASLVDLAGNFSEKKDPSQFTIDTTAPVFTVDFGSEDASHAKKTVDGVTYYDAARTATITVTEHNFAASKMNVVVSRDGGWVKNVPVVGEWDSEGDVHTCKVTFTEGGVYSLKVTGADLAGNSALLNGKEGATEYGSGSFVIDVTPPTVNVDKGKPTDENKRDFDNVIKDQAEKAAFDGVAYFDAPQEITVTVKDRNLDLDNSVITVDGKAVGKGDWSKSTSDDDVVTYTYTYTYDETPDKSGSSEGMSYTPDVQLVDLAGNTKARASQPFVIDKKAPSIDSVVVENSTTSVGSDKDSGEDPIQFYNSDTEMVFNVSDAHRIEKVELYDPENAYTGTSSIKRGAFDGTYSIALKDGANESQDTEYERDIYLQITDIAGNYRTWTIGRDGKIKNVTETDIANAVTINKSGVYPYALIKDVMPPETDLSGVTAGSYYNSAQTVHATVREFNFGYLQRFDGSRAVLHITKYEGNAGRAMSTYDIPASSFTGSGSDWAYDEVFSSDGHYIVEASFDDYANNSSNVSRIEEFTIDMTAPIITIEFDNNDVRNGMYYNATRTATITVEEHNFDPNLINIQTTGSIGGWSSSGDTHTCTVFFDEAASHNLTVSGNDLAGNAANEVTEPEFVVDLTAPEITFGGVAQRLGFTGEEDEYNSTLQPDSAYNGVVAPSITFEDEQNFDTAGTEFTLVGNKVGDVSNTYDYGQSYGSNSETVQFDDFGLKGTDTAYDVNADDIYTINAHMTDLAGNEAEGAITFSVNRFGSNYIVAVEENGQQVDLEASSILDEAPTITVREINVSGAKSEADHSVMKEYANATSEIERQDSGNAEGYRLDTLDRRNTDHGWAEYVYTIRSANFGEGSSSDTGDGGQGIYRVNVASDDTASNVNTTADYWSSDTVRAQASAKVGTAEFTLDEVAPVIDETTLPDFIAPGREYQASFHVTDAITQGNAVEVYVDGERVAVSREGQEVAEGEYVGEGSFEFTIPARSFATRKVAIKVTDYAGRSAEAGDSGFFVTTLIPEIGVVAGVAAAIAGGVAYSKRKKDDGESIYDDGSLLK